MVWSHAIEGEETHHIAWGVAVDGAHDVYWLVTLDYQGAQNTYLAKYTP